MVWGTMFSFLIIAFPSSVYCLDMKDQDYALESNMTTMSPNMTTPSSNMTTMSPNMTTTSKMTIISPNTTMLPFNMTTLEPTTITITTVSKFNAGSFGGGIAVGIVATIVIVAVVYFLKRRVAFNTWKNELWFNEEA